MDNESPQPNPQQQQVIDHREGILRVNAGPGTGKTFALARRLARLVEQTEDPSAVRMVTFTRNGLEEMRRGVHDQLADAFGRLEEQTLCTFHGLAHDLLAEAGSTVAESLGVSVAYAPNTRLLEEAVTEQRFFRDFYRRFHHDHPEHHGFDPILRDPTNLLGLLKTLAARGIVPTRTGWYQDGRDRLTGDWAAVKRQFRTVNEPNPGQQGPRQSDLRRNLRSLRDDHFPPEAPSLSELRGPSGQKQVDEAIARRAFEEDRGELLAFVHDLYFEYLRYALRHDVMNFGFQLVLAYILLCEEEGIRAGRQRRFLMVDEFQDTNPLQMKLMMLLSRTNNLCVVGDWRQSIFGFRNADPRNITAFEHRLAEYKDQLNRTKRRIDYPVDSVRHLTLRTNYRSAPPILDLAEAALRMPATQSETVDPAEPDGADPSLQSADPTASAHLTGLRTPDEPRTLRELLETLVHPASEAPSSGSFGYGDIAVLSRTASFGFQLYQQVTEAGLPARFHGSVPLFRSDPGRLVLAWFRVLADPTDARGWVVILMEAGVAPPNLPPSEAFEDRAPKQVLPKPLWSVRSRLGTLDEPGAIARRVLDRYEERGDRAQAIVEVLADLPGTPLQTLGDIVRFIERAYDQSAPWTLQTTAPPDALTIQTIHQAKGSEYPIVVIPNLNQGRFPSWGSSPSSPIQFEPPFGLRQSRRFEASTGMIYDNWKARFLRHCQPTDYDEERRLLYVALSRAQERIYFTASLDQESPFFTGLADHEQTDVHTLRTPTPSEDLLVDPDPQTTPDS